MPLCLSGFDEVECLGSGYCRLMLRSLVDIAGDCVKLCLSNRIKARKTRHYLIILAGREIRRAYVTASVKSAYDSAHGLCNLCHANFANVSPARPAHEHSSSDSETLRPVTAVVLR